MKYQEGLSETKKYLKGCCLKELSDIIENTGLSEQKAKIILMKYAKEKQRWFISDEIGCAESKVSKKTTQALIKIKSYLKALGLVG